MKLMSRRGFTLVEFIVTFGLIVLMSGLAIRALNPVGQLRSARNGQRLSHVNTIIGAVRANIGDQRTGKFSCASGDIPTSSKKMANSTGSYNIAPCLVPTYLFALPFDPSAPGAHYTSNTDYDTGYFIMIASSTGQITISAPSAELGKPVQVIR